MTLRIDWEGLIVGFESRSHRITHFFDRETGDVEQALVSDSRRHAEFSENPRFVALPRDQGERTLGDLEAFLPHCEDEACRRTLAASLQGQDSAATFRTTLLRFPKEEARFFHFKERQALERAQNWLSGQGIPFSRPDRGLTTFS
ncbi:MAG: UPF0158 family protein [Acidobacteria bacterium]|nr:UPF0158 family protein [Acidobacteriota bacterium]MCA1610925.1 UPF0158 family protein [Acidobacteriota bacterium]MCA1617354.1 UPF0158 family protein [Acidobacteriota bacterium]